MFFQKFFAVILFPFYFVCLYIYYQLRCLCNYCIVLTQAMLMMTPLTVLLLIYHIVSFPFVLLWNAVIGIAKSFGFAIALCHDVIIGDSEFIQEVLKGMTSYNTAY